MNRGMPISRPVFQEMNSPSILNYGSMMSSIWGDVESYKYAFLEPLSVKETQ